MTASSENQHIIIEQFLKNYLKKQLNYFNVVLLDKTVYLLYLRSEMTQVEKVEEDIKQYFNLEVRSFGSHYLWESRIKPEAHWLMTQGIFSKKHYEKILRRTKHY
jgi:hypothetical protein